MKMKTQATKNLTENNIKPTFPRIKIYEYLLEKKNHPSVDTVYQELVDEIPTLSRTTVYNTLHLFLEKGLVQPILINDNEVRYDGDVSVHGHFLCRKCSTVHDIFFRDVTLEDTALEGFEVESRQVYYTGVCPDCR